MKTVLTKFLAISCIGLLMLASCKKEGTKAIATDGTPGALTANTNTLTLDKTKLHDTAKVITFTVAKPNFGYTAAVTNTLEIDVATDNWASPTTAVLPAGALSQGYTTADFNALLLKLNLTAGVASDVQIRVKQAISSTKAIYSNVVTLSATPFNLSSSLYVPGAYQGWHPSTADSLVSPTSNGIFTGIINYTGSDLNFKVVTSRSEAWNGTNYGAGASDGTVSSTGGNLTAPADGGLLVTVNLNDNTITYTPQWSIIGDATPGGWGSDTNMLYDKATDTWHITANLTSTGTQAIKFRFKNDWTINLGGTGGTLSQNGANITIPVSGTYAVTLDANNNTYTLTKQ